MFDDGSLKGNIVHFSDFNQIYHEQHLDLKFIYELLKCIHVLSRL